MKEYKKIIDVKLYEEKARKQIALIKEIEEEDTRRHDFTLKQDTQEENYYTLTKYYNGEQKAQIYNTIDVITEHLKAIKQTLIDLKIK